MLGREGMAGATGVSGGEGHRESCEHGGSECVVFLELQVMLRVASVCNENLANCGELVGLKLCDNDVQRVEVTDCFGGPKRPVVSAERNYYEKVEAREVELKFQKDCEKHKTRMTEILQYVDADCESLGFFQSHFSDELPVVEKLKTLVKDAPATAADVASVTSQGGASTLTGASAVSSASTSAGVGARSTGVGSVKNIVLTFDHERKAMGMFPFRAFCLRDAAAATGTSETRASSAESASTEAATKEADVSGLAGEGSAMLELRELRVKPKPSALADALLLLSPLDHASRTSQAPAYASAFFERNHTTLYVSPHTHTPTPTHANPQTQTHNIWSR